MKSEIVAESFSKLVKENGALLSVYNAEIKPQIGLKIFVSRLMATGIGAPSGAIGGFYFSSLCGHKFANSIKEVVDGLRK